MKKRATNAAIVAIGLMLLTACGGGSTTADIQVDETITVDARNVKFVPDHITVPAGKVVRLILTNSDAGTEHDLMSDDLKVTIMQGSGHGSGHGSTPANHASMLAVHAKGSESMSVIFKADKPGTYNIYCTIPGHKEAGMVGTIKVV